MLRTILHDVLVHCVFTNARAAAFVPRVGLILHVWHLFDEALLQKGKSHILNMHI